MTRVKNYAVSREERGIDSDVELVENPWSGETLVDEFAMDTVAARDRLGWVPVESVAGSTLGLLSE